MNNYIQLIREVGSIDPNRLLQRIIELMRSAVTQLYDTVEAQYGTTNSIADHIEFEVTFMTKSIRDGNITIAAWASRDGRAPKTLAKRATDPTIYSETETAKLYADENRTVRVISSTTDVDYRELYPGQKTRIQSSIIYPVVDDAFTLVGTLVVHCDRTKFFSIADIKTWRELLEPYTKRLALARVAADKLVETNGGMEPF